LIFGGEGVILYAEASDEVVVVVAFSGHLTPKLVFSWLAGWLACWLSGLLLAGPWSLASVLAYLLAGFLAGGLAGWLAAPTEKLVQERI
jgi:hypothetical protein